MFEDGLNGEHEEGRDDEVREDEDEGLLLRQEEDGHDDDHDDSHGDGRFPWSFFVVLLSFYALFFIERIFIPKIMARTGSKSDTSAKEEKLENGEEETDFLLDHSMERPTEGFTSSAFLIGLVQVLGLTVHSAIESIVLGLSPRFSVVLNIFIATLSHRWATSMALAIKLVQQLNYLPFLVLFVIFSLAVPAGVGIGIALTSLSLITQGVLFSISAGTFIYIGAYENMVEEFVLHKPWMFRKFIVMLAGAAIICVITAILVAKDVHG